MPDPTESAVIRLLYQFRATLDSREDQVMLEMARRYLAVQAAVEADIQALALEMERRRAEGKVITEQLIWRDERFKRINAQLSAQIARFSAETLPIIEDGQYANATLGLQAANDAISASFIDAGAFGPAWNRLNINAIESMIGFAGDGTPLNKLLKAAYPDALDGLTQALVTGMARGLGPAAVAKMMSDGSSMGLERSLLIARTEMMRSYRVASTRQYRESGVVSGYFRLVKKATACAACLFLDGQAFDLESELSDHPRGKCQAVPQVIGVGKPTWYEGRDWFMDQDPAKQREILGEGRYNLWRDGQISLDAIPRMKHSDEWGDSPRVASIQELTHG